MTPDVPSGCVLIRSVDARYRDSENLTMLLDTGPPTPSGDFGGWDSIVVPRKRAVRTWTANPDAKLDLDVILLKGDDTVASQIKTLQAMGTGTVTKGGGFRRPRQVEIFGQLPPLAVTRWVIDNVTWGGAIYNRANRLIEQRLTITLGEPPDLDAIDVGGQGRSKYRTRNGKRVKRPTAALLAGETLQEFAARTLGNPSRWSEIAKLQKPPIKDPRHPEKVGKKTVKGRRLRLPAA